MAALTDAEIDAGTSGVSSCRHPANVRFSDSHVPRPTRTLRQMRLHRRAHGRIDVAFEML
jgi:hypothetical protein